MLTNPMFLVCVALLPAIVLCSYIFKKDRVEKEPAGLLILLFILGAVSCIPAGIIEIVAMSIADGIAEAYKDAEGVNVIYNAVNAFAIVALTEEALKFLMLYLATRKNKNFNSLFDGIVYSVFVSLGFAALENVLYVLDNGFANAVSRAILSVPCHMFFAVIMGYYYSFWHMHDVAEKQEKKLMEEGIIPNGKSKFFAERYLLPAIVMPVLAHGFYDFGLFMGTVVSVLLALAFTVFLYIYCFSRIKNVSKKDVDDITYATQMICDKYPHVRALYQQSAQEELQQENEVSV